MELKETNPQILLDRRFDFGANQRKIEHELLLRNVKAVSGAKILARTLPAVHGTTLERLVSIQRDTTLHAHRQLRAVHPEIVDAREENATDELDIQLGLDNYAFLCIGRVHPADVQAAYILFPNQVIDEQGALINLREIAHHGALVSPEAKQKAKEEEPSLDIDAINAQATKNLFAESLNSKRFRDIFPAFITKWTPTAASYAFQKGFPNTPPASPGKIVGWEGPQLMIPHQISVTKSFGVLLPKGSDEELDYLVKSGVPHGNIFTMQDLLVHYGKSGYPIDKYWQDGGRFRYTFLNVALRDLSLRNHNFKPDKSLEEAVITTRKRCEAFLP